MVEVSVAEGLRVGGAGVRVRIGSGVSVGPDVFVGAAVVLGTAGAGSVGTANPTWVKVGRGAERVRVGLITTAVAPARLLTRSAARQPSTMTHDNKTRPKTMRGDDVRCWNDTSMLQVSKLEG